ncbi:MAG: hypothetical protein Q9196_004232 [Gyalolechia fulgens]
MGQLKGASSSRWYPEQASGIASNIQKQSPCRPCSPLRRSPRLNRLPQLDEITTHAVEQLPVTDGWRRSLRSRLKPSTRCTANPSKPAPGLTHPLRPRGLKRAREGHNLGSTKRRRTSDTPPAPEESSRYDGDIDPIDYWRRSGYCWPTKDWAKKSLDINPAMSHLLARKKSTGSLRRKRPDSESAEQSSNTQSDQKSREAKSAPYRDARYETLIATKGSFMGKHPLGISDASKSTCRNLLETQQSVPGDTLFRDDLFEETCEALRNRNEARVIRDITLLIVPSAESLAIRGDKHLRCLIESVNEEWNNSIPITTTRPQPDYAVGFRREAFNEEQLGKLHPFVGELTDQSFFMATYYLYFPFLTSEVKCGAAALNVADRQNAHSMTLAVRAVVELFRLVKREKELDREMLAFSVSHDHRSVRIYGHYAVIEKTKTTFYRHPIHTFDFTALDGKDKWTAYRFTKSIYRTWMPSHFARLCSVIDALPADLNFELSEQSELQFPEQTGLSQGLAHQNMSTLNAESVSSAHGDESQLQPLEPVGTPDTSLAKDSVQGGTKKPRKGRR